MANVSPYSGLTQFAAERFSPTDFSPGHVISDALVDTLLDATRRTPSAGNSQPWAFIVGRRGDDVHTRLVHHLSPGSSRWAPSASLLIANLAHVFVEDSDLAYSEFSRYDLGQAVAHPTFETHDHGLAVHQFRGFDRAGIAAEFIVPPHWEVTSLAAVGVPVDPATDDSRAGTSRDRRSVDDITWARTTAPTAP